MTDRADQPDRTDAETLLEDLEHSDSSDAPNIAERLADRLTADLDSTGSDEADESGPGS